MALAARQYGYFTTDQGRGAGLSRAATHRLVASAVLEREGPRLYRVAGAPRTWKGRAMGAVLGAGPNALASHRTAAHLWSLEGFGPTGRIEVTVPRHSRPRRRTGVLVHETVAWELAQPTTRWGIPVTSAARTLIDLAMVADDVAVLRALDEIRRQRFATWPQLWETFILHARRGRPGIVKSREALERRYGQIVPDTEFARLFMLMVEDAGLPIPVGEHWIAVNGYRYRVDLAYQEARVAIELDGKDTHLTDAAFESDRERDNRLRIAGWTVLRYTWRRFVESPREIASELRTLLG